MFPNSFTMASLRPSSETETQVIGTLFSGLYTVIEFKILSTLEDCVTNSIVKDPFIKSNTLMNPDSSAVIISV